MKAFSQFVREAYALKRFTMEANGDQAAPEQKNNPTDGSTQNKTTDPEKKDPRQRRISQKYDIFPFTPRKAEETD